MTHACGGELVHLLDQVFFLMSHFPLMPPKSSAFKKEQKGKPSSGIAKVKVDESLEWCSRTTYMGPVQ